MEEVKFNSQVKLIVSDVDETIADLYLPADPAIIKELTTLLTEGRSIFFVSGAGLGRIQNRIIDSISPALRYRILVAHCSGAEVWGFDEKGRLLPKAYYSVYDQEFTAQEKKDLWRAQVQKLIGEFHLVTYPATAISEFKKVAGDNPLAVMMEDRGPQITFEVVNGYNIPAGQAKDLGFSPPEGAEFYDIRDVLLPKSEQLFKEVSLPVTPRTGGEFALDFAVEGVNKTTAVKHVVESEEILKHIGLSKGIIEDPANIEIWGDKFSVNRGGTDRHMSEALPKEVRSIDFREENPAEFLPGYNMVIWRGKQHLHHGTLEYLRSRKPH